MRTIKLICLGLAACLPTMVLAASTAPVASEHALREECSAFSQAGMRDCLAEKAKNSQTALRQAEEKMAGALSKWDEDSRYVNEAKAKLVTSNKKFVEYRETQCGFSAAPSGGGAGNAHESGRLACVSELNNRRAEQLRDAASDLLLK
ncbi:lysozyme inhibitor LprI family protein [Paraburkholderia sp. HP33-1]|uniref:lysozyme inhibitor LprI family protein n=1 Tax=Paraburkholderia sp. HP33-1 TaxID=2883243 RepID=UPI001F419B9D|nr:lysozyme inhibitor LprI family protein [Paraburkholderia sp. HP33-1]